MARLRPRHWGLAPSVIASLIGVALATLAVMGIGWLTLGRPSVRLQGTDQALEAVKIGLAVVAGLGAAFGLTVSYRRQRGDEQRHRAEEGAAFTARYTTAAEQIGHDAAAVRLAGVYALARLADDWEGQRQTCIDVLCAYLRMPYEPSTATAAEREVRFTVIQMIRQHLVEGAIASWQGRSLDFTGATFDGGDFSRATFSGGVSFRNATFSGGGVVFGGATFRGNVDFTGATFSGPVDFTAATFTGDKVDFARATFRGGNISFVAATFNEGYVNFVNVFFDGGSINFRLAKFTGGRVDFTGATFTGGNVGFSDAAFRGGTVYFSGGTFGDDVSFFGATFTGGKVEFTAATFSGGKVSFRNATFSGGDVSFNEATFDGGLVDFASVRDWSVPPRWLPQVETPGLTLPPKPTPTEPREPEQDDDKHQWYGNAPQW